ncbi:MAG: phenylalanine--tRNA ligase beta subunit-related protein [Candidatus Shapirobacteria bacterium]|nr:phenylalanine--tRNA ligase beta subunit-related protein [Candidatus Shapirobacteria bacterium]
MRDLTLIGHFVDGLERKNKETIISLEIKQNRPDCLGYLGIAKDLAALYNLKLKEPSVCLPPIDKNITLPIKIRTKNQVTRVMAIKISSLNNHPSSDWLKKILKLHDINSINTIVDLTNYIMLLWGIPNHAFDTQKSTDRLIWETNKNKFKTFTSLDNTKVTLEKDTLQIHNNQDVLSLAGIVGGQNSGVGLETKEIIIEMAIYNPKRVWLDSKKLNITTEASIRLEKQLDPQLIPSAFNHLVKLILENCQGKITSAQYDYYPQPKKQPIINFKPQSPGLFAGIKIETEFAQKILKKLGCQVTKKGANLWRVVPPSLRSDLELEEDLVEEVIRFWGYQNIPTDQPISAKILPDITPKIVYLIEAVKNCLVNLGYDEVRSWPLIKKSQFFKAYFLPQEAKPIYTQNNVNDRYPLLRASIISSLEIQNYQYQKLKIPQRRFFEIGKIFYQVDHNYQERWSLGVFDQSEKKLTKKINLFYQELGITKSLKIIPRRFGGGVMIEIDLEDLVNQLAQIPKIIILKPSQLTNGAAQELTGQIIDLDANLIFSQKKDPKKLIEKYQTKFRPDILWQLVVLDIYPKENYHQNQSTTIRQNKKSSVLPIKTYKYTLRAFYYNCSAQEAKKIHQRIFGKKV